MRTVMDMCSSLVMRSFAISTVDTKWPIPGEGMKINSIFLVLVIFYFLGSKAYPNLNFDAV